jgi:hypothetical protein
MSLPSVLGCSLHGETRKAFKVMVGKPIEKRQLGNIDIYILYVTDICRFPHILNAATAFIPRRAHLMLTSCG